MTSHPGCQPVAGEFNKLTVRVEKTDGVMGTSYNAQLHINLRIPYTKEVKLEGPTRKTRPEAIRDGMELGKRFVVEGEAGAKTVLLRLRKKQWTFKEMEAADEAALERFVLPQLQEQKVQPVEKKLVPPGEGWVRHSDELLVHPQSHVYFAQAGSRAGTYLVRAADGSGWEDTSTPHVPRDVPIVVRAASASCMQRGAKLDRAVLLNDITRISRLALKTPLSFVDRPACAYALFQGLRNSESAQWCAENFHKKLLPRLAEKIHEFHTGELELVLKATLEELDEELIKSSHAFSGCSGLVVLLLGDRIVAAGVGDVRAVLLSSTEDGKRASGRPASPSVALTKLLDARSGGLASKDERDRVKKAGGTIKQIGMSYNLNVNCAFAPVGAIAGGECVDEASRILGALHVFDVLPLGVDGTDESAFPSDADEKQVRSAYRRLALRVHPDKQPEGFDAGAFQAAFARLESAKEALEGMINESVEACRELCRVLRSDVRTREGAATLLGVDKTATTDTELVTQDATKASETLIKKFAKLQGVAPDYKYAVAICQEAVQTLQRGCTPEALPRQEALLKEAVTTSRAMGVRDLRYPRPVVLMEPVTASCSMPEGACIRLGILCGATAALDDARLVQVTTRHPRRPKASALRWCQDADSSTSCSSAICISLGQSQDKDMPPVKKARTSGTSDGTVRVRHILLRHQQLKQPDPMMRREGSARTAQEAEEAAVRALETLLDAPTQFPKLCRELSDCQTAEQPGNLCGDLGWLGRGSVEQTLEDAIFALVLNEMSDVLTSSRGVHIIQRLA